jgi:HK97 family phage major capsid protein
MTMPSTVADAVTAARAAIAAVDYAEAERLTAHAKAIKSLDGLGDTQPRLPLQAAEEPKPEAGAQDIAVKSWFVGRYGEFDPALEQIGRELYGHIAPSYQKAAYLKNADFIRYLKTGHADPILHRTILYSPAQLTAAVIGGASVAELKATQIESQDVLGGYLVPEDVRDRIVQRLEGAVIMRRMNTAMPTGRDRVTMPVVLGGDDRYPGAVRAFWVDESPTSAQSETNSTFGQVGIPVHTLMANTPISKSLMEDSQGALAIVGIVERLCTAAFRIAEDEAFLVGDGAGKPQGVLRDASTGGPNTFSYGSIASVNSGVATALTADAFRNLPYAIASQYRDLGCAWAFSRNTARVIKTLKAGDGTYLWSGRSDTPQLAQGQPTSLEGYPIMETEVLASTTTNSNTTYTANVYPVIFIARDAYQIVDRVGMDIQRYDDSTTAVQNQIKLVARRRVGGQPINPWAIAVMKVSA